MKRRSSSSPAKSEPGKSGHLLRVALTRSASTRRNAGVSDIRRGKNDSSVLSDLSNISSNSTMDNTQTKKIAALAKFKQLDIDITPRAALREFNQANQSDAQTPALYVPPRKKKTEAESGPSTAAAKAQGESPAGDLRDVLSDLSSDESSLADTKQQRRSVRLSRSHATVDDLDPERDLTKPTCISVGGEANEESFLLDDTGNETVQVPRRRQRQKTKNFSLTDFDVTKQPEKGLAEASSASLLEDSHNDSEMIIKERMEKKRKLLEKRYARKTRVQAKAQRHNWDFSGLVPPTSVEDQDQTGTGSSDQDPRTERQTEDISNLIEDDVQEEEDEENDQTLVTEDPPEKRRTLDVDNLVEFDTDEEKTPVKVQKDKDDAQTQPMENLLEEKRTFDGDNLLAFDTDEEEKTPVKQVKEKDDGQVETQVMKDPREKKRTFESASLVEFDTDEEEETPVVTRQKRSKRNPITDSDFQDITQTVQKVDTPDRQSAGIETAEASPAATKSFSLTQNESVVTRRSARISRENLSDVEKTLSRQERSSFINKSQTKKSKLPPIHNTPSPPQSPREQREEVSEEIIEEEMVESPERMVERKGRKSVYEAGLGMAGRSLLDGTVVFRPETESTRIASLSDFNLGPSSPLQRGQQMAKPGRDTSTPFAKAYRQEFLSKTAQVTGEERRVVRVNQTIDPQMPTPKILEVVKEARKSGLRSMRLSRYQSTIREDIIEGGTQTTPQVQDDNVEAGCQVTPGLMEQHSAVGNQNFSEVNDSLTEEVNIELPQEDHNDESFQPNISNSGRKNPSPIIERRSEVEAEENDEEYSENDDEEVVEAEENDDEEVFEKEEMMNNEDEMITDQVEVAEDDPGAGSLAYLRLPEPGSSKALPKRREQKELRQATLERYLGDFRTTASPLVLSPLNSPQKEKAVEKPKAKPKSKTNKKADPGLIFGEKQIKFEYQRFSRYKLKKDAEKTLVKASKDFLNEALKQMSSFAEERGAETIHLCDIKRMMIQCQFIPSQEEDPKERDFHQTLHDIARFEQIEELIPCNRGLGEMYPPKDCWELKGGKGKKRRTSAGTSSGKTGGKVRKGENIKRYKGQKLNESEDEN